MQEFENSVNLWKENLRNDKKQFHVLLKEQFHIKDFQELIRQISMVFCGTHLFQTSRIENSGLSKNKISRKKVCVFLLLFFAALIMFFVCIDNLFFFLLLSYVAFAFNFYVIFVCVCWWLYCVVCFSVVLWNCLSFVLCWCCVLLRICAYFYNLHIASLAFLFEFVWRGLLRVAFQCV